MVQLPFEFRYAATLGRRRPVARMLAGWAARRPGAARVWAVTVATALMIGLLAIARLALVESEIRELVIAIMWSTITAAFAAARELVMIAVAVPMLAAALGMVIAAVATAFMSAVVGELVRPMLAIMPGVAMMMAVAVVAMMGELFAVMSFSIMRMLAVRAVMAAVMMLGKLMRAVMAVTMMVTGDLIAVAMMPMVGVMPMTVSMMTAVRVLALALLAVAVAMMAMSMTMVGMVRAVMA